MSALLQDLPSFDDVPKQDVAGDAKEVDARIGTLSRLARQAVDDAVRADRQPVGASPAVPNASHVAGESYSALAEWEGTVIEVGQETFSASLMQIPRGTIVSAETRSRLRNSVQMERTELPIEDVLPTDRDLLKQGALFRMVVGYLISPTGTRRRSLSVVFRRLPQWRESDLRGVRRMAKEEEGLFDSIPRPQAD